MTTSAISETKSAELRAEFAVKGLTTAQIDAAMTELETRAKKLLALILANECPECAKGLVFVTYDDGAMGFGCEADADVCPFEIEFDAETVAAWKLDRIGQDDVKTETEGDDDAAKSE